MGRAVVKMLVRRRMVSGRRRERCIVEVWWWRFDEVVLCVVGSSEGCNEDGSKNERKLEAENQTYAECKTDLCLFNTES